MCLSTILCNHDLFHYNYAILMQYLHTAHEATKIFNRFSRLSGSRLIEIIGQFRELDLLASGHVCLYLTKNNNQKQLLLTDFQYETLLMTDRQSMESQY